VELAFQEAGADVTRYLIDLQNKPEWYASRINPAGKVSHSSLQVAFIRVLTGVIDRFPPSCTDLPRQTRSIHPQSPKR
jgi:hypothetical protein